MLTRAIFRWPGFLSAAWGWAVEGLRPSRARVVVTARRRGFMVPFAEEDFSARTPGVPHRASRQPPPDRSSDRGRRGPSRPRSSGSGLAAHPASDALAAVAPTKPALPYARRGFPVPPR